MPPNGPREPIIETPPHELHREETGDRALSLRIRQQEILAELGVTALKGTPFDDLLREAVRLSAQGLNAELCKVLEYMPAQNRLLMRAGVGWDEGLVGIASVGADLASPSGYALRTGKPVISNHLASEERFRTPDLLAAHGVRRAINVILQGDGALPSDGALISAQRGATSMPIAGSAFAGLRRVLQIPPTGAPPTGQKRRDRS